MYPSSEQEIRVPLTNITDRLALSNADHVSLVILETRRSYTEGLYWLVQYKLIFAHSESSYCTIISNATVKRIKRIFNRFAEEKNLNMRLII